jgi:hypothetical protein
MSVVRASAQKKSILVTLLGLLNLALGGAYALLGGSALYAGIMAPANARANFGEDWALLATMFGIIPAILIVIGLAFLLFGVLMFLAGLGIIWRNEIARIVALILAVLVVLLGLLLAIGGNRDAESIALGAVQIGYGILAIIALISRRAEFGRRSPQNEP